MRNFIARFRGEFFRQRCILFKKNIDIKGGLKIYKRLKIVGEGKVYIGENCIINGIIGDDSKYVTIDTHHPSAVIKIGDNVGLYAARISSKFQVTIGNNVLIEDSGILDTDFHTIDKSRTIPTDENKDKCKINIGNNVCIGVNCLVTKGVKIIDNVIVTPGSVVSLNIKSSGLVSGNPARPIRS